MLHMGLWPLILLVSVLLSSHVERFSGLLCVGYYDLLVQVFGFPFFIGFQLLLFTYFPENFVLGEGGGYLDIIQIEV